MNETFKTELAAFTEDVKAICKKQLCCYGCPLGTGDTKPCAANYNNFNADKAIAAVEAYRRRKKPCAEVIDRALDVYTIEVEVERNEYAVQVLTPEQGAKYAATYLMDAYPGDGATVRILSAKRFALESHREEENDGD